MKRIALVGVVLVVALAGAIVVKIVRDKPEPLVIVHWANSHPMREGLLPQMEERFNDAGHETASGRPIEIRVVSCDSAAQVKDLVSRVKGSGPAEEGCDSQANPTIVTPQSDDWLGDVNYLSAQHVVDVDNAPSIAKAWVGIVTYRDIAGCLGWPDKLLGYGDIIALLDRGWQGLPDPSCASTTWGPRPLLAFTNPSTSTSGRNVLVSLYSTAAGQEPADLTERDVERSDVVEYVKHFQGLVDHYQPGTIPLNTKVDQGKRYGHFFLMPEDNLVNLYKGTEKARGVDGKEHSAKRVKDMVMIYPKEGAALNSNPAGIVQARWATEEKKSAAQQWISFLREDDQQRTFMEAGFRPGINLPVAGSVRPRFGLDPHQPKATVEPGDLDPAVSQKIMESWGQVKKPAVVTFVVDTSGSMGAGRLRAAKDGLLRVLETMEPTTQVGLVTFSDGVNDDVLVPRSLEDSKFDIAKRVDSLAAGGATALYSAVLRGARLTAEAPGDENTTRAVVVLSDGEANVEKDPCLTDLITIKDRGEAAVQWCGKIDTQPVNSAREGVRNKNLRGDGRGSLLESMPPVQIFFVGFGEADITVGRVMAQATSGEYVGSTEEDLTAVITDLGPYF